MNTKEKILEQLKTGPKTDAEISQAISVPVPTVRRCRGELVKRDLVEPARMNGRTATWQLPTAKVKVARPRMRFNEPKSRPPETRPPGTIWF